MAGAEPPPPLRVRNAGGSPNVIPVFDIAVSGATLTRTGAGRVQLLIDSGAGGTGAPTGAAYVTYQADPTLTAELILTSGTGLVVSSNATNFFVSLSTPVVVSSGGTGRTTLTNRGVLIGSAANPIESLAAMSRGQLIVGTDTTIAPQLLVLGSQGQSLIIDTTNQRVGIGWQTRRGRFPMALSTVIPTSANAFWMAKSGTLLDTSFVAYADSGLGVATFWTVIPLNLFPNPNWNILFYNAPNISSGGNLVYSLSGRVVAAAGSIDGVVTSLVQGGTMGIGSANALTISTASSTNFDSTLTLTSGNMLHVALLRHANTAGDTLSDQWNCYSLVLECNVV